MDFMKLNRGILGVKVVDTHWNAKQMYAIRQCQNNNVKCMKSKM